MTTRTRRSWILGVAQLVAWGALYFPPAVLAGDVARDLAIERGELFAWLGGSLAVSSFSGGLVARALERWGGRAVLVAGTLVGALIMGVLRNGLNLLGVSSFLQQVVIGAVIVIAVLVDTVLKRHRA